MTRGFLTIATGDLKYHKMAYILLLSYKLSTNRPLPFAVITDKDSEYTAQFDTVIKLENATRSYMDKITMLNIIPFDQTIFIDSDCIVYNDLNRLFDLFTPELCFSAFGRITESNGWYRKENLGEYAYRVNDLIDFHGGVYFIKKCELLSKVYKDAINISKNYSDYQFKGFNKPADEPILALSMAANGLKPISPKPESFVWLRRAKWIKADFFKNKLKYSFENGVTEFGNLIHFGTAHTIEPLYLIESEKVKYRSTYNKSWTKLQGACIIIKSYVKSFVLLVRYSFRLIKKRSDI